MSNTRIDASPGKQIVIVTRTINAPRELVFKTVTDPLLVPEWWGPRTLITTVYKMIVMPGGSYRYLQRDRQGKEYGFHGIYHDVVIPERLVYTMEYEGMPGHVSLNIDTFEDAGGQTLMTSSTIFESVADRDQMMQWGMEEGTTEITNRLNELLATTAKKKREDNLMTHHQHVGDGKHIKIVREFDAPIDKVWERFTDPEKYKCWWGPKDFTAPYAKFDLRPGGKYLSSMRDPEGREFWSTGTYKEIVEPNRIVVTDSFADEYGNIVPASYYGMKTDMPMEMELEVNFEEVGDKTRVTLEHCGIPEGDDLDNAKLGWEQSLDKLEECLS
jgi:uncharacterized protein YndB with AHSA1/START domain